MFPFNDVTGDPDNWKLDFNSIVGGQGFQHPHSNIGKAGSFKHLDVFPCVALHGYGLNEFALWLLPPNSDYEFLRTFESHQILFMRGDQPPHAGIAPMCPEDI